MAKFAIRTLSDSVEAVTSTDHSLMCNPPSGGQTLNAPPSVTGPASPNGLALVIKDKNGNASGSRKITFTPASGQSLEPGLVAEIATAYGVLRLVLDGTVWRPW